MGKAKNGILGPITGKVGNLSFYQVNGEARVRTIGVRTAEPSALQRQYRNKMGLSIAFSNTMKPFIKVGFANAAKGTKKNYHNLATSYNLLHAVQMIDGLVSINYNEVRLSAGTALQPLNPGVQLRDEGLVFSWQNPEQESWTISQDQVMLLAFFPDMFEARYVVNGAKRAAEHDLLPLTPACLQQRMEVYMAFVTEDRSNVSDSIYLGRIN